MVLDTGIFLLFDPFDLEAWSFASTIWAGFGTLALIPIIQIVRKRNEEKKKEHMTIKERIEDLCERLGIVEHKVENHGVKVDGLEKKYQNLRTDVRVLEALDDQDKEDHKRDRDKDEFEY